MGLDTYAGARYPTAEDWDEFEARFGLSDEDLAAFEQAEAELAGDGGGICIFGGNYFRGRIVADLVERISDVSLYREWIPPETVCFMAEAFEDCDAAVTNSELVTARPDYGQDESTIEELRVFFRICADRHLGLVGSW